MKAIMENLTGALLVAATALGTGRPQSAALEQRLSDIVAQQPHEVIYASAPCQRARENINHKVFRRDQIASETLVADLGALMEKSDEVILAGILDQAYLLSPSGESVASYYEVRVIRNWKGTHGAGDVLTFGVPSGSVDCAPSGPNHSSFTVLRGEGADWQGVNPGWGEGPYVYVLFLRQSAGDETHLVQGLRLAAGEGVQGMFLIHVPVPLPFDAEKYCAGVLDGSVQHCDSYLENSKSPVMDPYDRDPLAQKYAGMPASDFLQEVQSVVAGQGSAEKSSSKR
jgi:hypothetical protein